MKVENYKAKNQFYIERLDERLQVKYQCLQSYDALVVEISTNYKEASLKTIVLSNKWNYSKTTAKYVYLFLEEYGEISFENVSNKKAYIEKLIKNKKIFIE